MTLALIIPVKGLSEGKSRLQCVLNPDSRTRLNRFLAMRTFGIAREVRRFAEVFVVSKSDEVLTLAQRYSLSALREPAEAMLNEAISFGRSAALKAGCSEVLVLPVDLIYLSADRLKEIIRFGAGADVTLVTDASGTGTNLILWKSIEAANFLFGPDSAKLHAINASDRGLSVRRIKDDALSFDLDLPSDLMRWKLRSHAGASIRQPEIEQNFS